MIDLSPLPLAGISRVFTVTLGGLEGHVSTAETLIDNGADVNAKEANGKALKDIPELVPS